MNDYMRILIVSWFGCIILAAFGCGADNSAVAPANPVPPPAEVPVNAMGSKAEVPMPPK